MSAVAKDQDKLSIEIKIEGGMLQVAGPIVLAARYKNGSQYSMVFDEPAKLWETQVVVEKDGRQETVSLGRIFHYINDAGVERRVVEDAKEITLVPGGTYEFSYDLGFRWPDLYTPGHYMVRLDDRSEQWGIKSNSVEIDVVMTQGSVEVLLDILVSAASEREAKGFSLRILKELNTSFDYDVSKPQEFGTNGQEVKEFRAWWEASKNSEIVLKKISAMNDRYWEWQEH